MTKEVTVAGFKDNNFNDRKTTAANAKKALIEKFRQKPAADDPAVLARIAAQKALSEAREARAAERKAQREAEAAQALIEQAAREAERAAKEAELIAQKAAKAAADKLLEAERKAARDARYAARKARR
jgi:hypothetical protein